MCFVIPHLITDRCVPTEPSLQPDWYFSKVLKSCPLSTVCAEGITPVYHMDGSAVQDDFNPYSSSLSCLVPGLGSAGAMRSCVCCLQTVIFRPMSHPKGSTGLHFCTKPLVSILPKRPFPFRLFPSPTNSHTVVFTASLTIFLGFPVNIFHACALIYFHFFSPFIYPGTDTCHNTWVEARGQLTRVSSRLSPYSSQAQNSDFLSWRQLSHQAF